LEFNVPFQHKYGCIRDETKLPGLCDQPLFMTLFYTSDRNIVESCQEKFGFMLPSIQLDKRRKKFEEKYMNACDMYI